MVAACFTGKGTDTSISHLLGQGHLVGEAEKGTKAFSARL